MTVEEKEETDNEEVGLVESSRPSHVRTSQAFNSTLTFHIYLFDRKVFKELLEPVRKYAISEAMKSPTFPIWWYKDDNKGVTFVAIAALHYPSLVFLEVKNEYDWITYIGDLERMGYTVINGKPKHIPQISNFP